MQTIKVLFKLDKCFYFFRKQQLQNHIDDIHVGHLPFLFSDIEKPTVVTNDSLIKLHYTITPLF